MKKLLGEGQTAAASLALGLAFASVCLASGCSTETFGGCSTKDDCGPGEYCALGVCKRPIGTTGSSAASASSTGGSSTGSVRTVTSSATGAATSGGGFGTTGGLVGTTGGSTTGGAGTSAGTGTGSNGGTGTGGSASGGSTSGGAGDVYCTPCKQDSDCGGTNLCVTFDGITAFCGVDCASTLTCSEADADCESIGDGMGGVAGTDCVPTSGVCPAGASDGGTVTDDYCLTCTTDKDCGGESCITLDDFDYFCAPDCSQTGKCTEAGASCYELDDDLGDFVGDYCEPDSEICDD